MNIKYRPEIDGLRAIAVVGVILYHAQIQIFGYQHFEGGFIGVDIFFVISGYLISSIILQELVTTGNFSFKYFYERRIRRILPALLFVMLVSLPFAWMYLLPNSFIDYSKSILYSLGFSSNLYFWYFGQEYGAEIGLLKPFLHTWSLSVEEQYYILFPIFLLLAFKYFKKYLLMFLVLVFIISLLIANWGSESYPAFNFYILLTRGWELLAGSILAYFEIIRGWRQSKKHYMLNLILPSIGLVLIGHSFLFFNDKMFHPSFYTLSPIVGVCIIIWFSHKGELITNILSSKLFVGIGLISYSLYLWHYPIFAFARISQFTEGDILKKLFLGIVILLLSIISYFLIERAARNKKNKFKFVLCYILFFSFALITVNSIIISKKGFKDRLPEFLQKSLSEQPPWTLLKNSENKECFNLKEGCVFNSLSNKSVFIIGDSHTASISFNLKGRITKKDYSFILPPFSTCLYFPGFDLVSLKTNKIDENCNKKNFSQLEKTLKELNNSIIIFGGRFPVHLENSYFDNKEGGLEAREWPAKYITTSVFDTIQSSFKNSVNELSQTNKIILIYPIPEVGWKVPNKIFKIWLNKKNKFSNNFKLEKNITTSYLVYKERTKSSFKLLDSIQGNNIYRVYPHTLFCDTLIKDRCVTHDDKNIFYRDQDHPSSKGAEMINDLIMKEIEKIETNSN